MNLVIRSVDFNYDTNGAVVDVSVRYDYFEDSFSINGLVKVTQDEYATNATSTSLLSQLAFTKVKDRINLQ